MKQGVTQVVASANIGALRLQALASDLSPLPESSGRAASAETLVLLAPLGAYLNPQCAAHAFTAAMERPDVGLFYGDEVGCESGRPTLYLKPRFNPALAQASAYMGGVLVARAGVIERLGGLRRDAGTATLQDLTLRAMRAGVGLDSIRQTLAAYAGPPPRPRAEDSRAVLEAFVSTDAGGWRVLDGLAPGSLRLRRSFQDHPLVSLIVPTRQAAHKGSGAFVVRLLESLCASTWPAERFRVLIGDDERDATAYGDLGRFPFEVRRIHTPLVRGGSFNYSTKMNLLWREAGTEQLVLMNDDIEVLAPDWLEALMTFAVDEDVGGVGARLVYPDGRLQHAGMPGGPFGTFAHAWLGQPGDAPTYQNWALIQRDWSAVTGAVFATRRSALEAVNGFDEGFALEFNDVDLCLRLKLLGYRIVFAPDALMRHYERASRGGASPMASQQARFLNRWEDLIEDDPSYHPNMTRESLVIQPTPPSSTWYAGLLQC